MTVPPRIPNQKPSMTHDVTVRTFFRDRPLDATLSTLVPLVVAGALLANAYIHELSLTLPFVFTGLLVAQSIMATRHRLASVRLARLQATRSTAGTSAD